MSRHTAEIEFRDARVHSLKARGLPQLNPSLFDLLSYPLDL
jgi:hypothetical protein